jgi:Single-strand binding protein family.
VKVEIVGSEGKKVLNNRLAMKISKNQTSYIDLVAWDAKAELIERFYHKGYEILFQGKLINKKKIIGNGLEFDGNALLVEDVIFTNGNGKDRTSSTEYDSNIEPDFLR